MNVGKEKYKMKLKNESQYSSRSLKKIFTVAFKEYQKGVKDKLLALKFKRVTARVYNNRTSHVNGSAWYNSRNLRIGIPFRGIKSRWFKDKSDAYEVAFVFIHELLHTCGFRHSKMVDAMTRKVIERIENLPDLELKPAPEKKPKQDLQLIRHGKAK
jgi:hypothetical protein